MKEELRHIKLCMDASNEKIERIYDRDDITDAEKLDLILLEYDGRKYDVKKLGEIIERM